MEVLTHLLARIHLLYDVSDIDFGLLVLDIRGSGAVELHLINRSIRLNAPRRLLLRRNDIALGRPTVKVIVAGLAD